ncbi:MAG: hypothetical protein H0V68_10025 [Actinobacteria bacterium]|nr:hypothetical protein [Actinomycetota bacterium]
MAAVGDDLAELVLRLEQVMEALADEHEGGAVRELGRPEELGQLGARLEVEERHVRSERRAGDRVHDRIGELGRHVACSDSVPLDLVRRIPAVRLERGEPVGSQVAPVGLVHGHAAEGEQPVVTDPAALVQEEEAHEADATR